MLKWEGLGGNKFVHMARFRTMVRMLELHLHGTTEEKEGEEYLSLSTCNRRDNVSLFMTHCLLLLIIWYWPIDLLGIGKVVKKGDRKIYECTKYLSSISKGIKKAFGADSNLAFSESPAEASMIDEDGNEYEVSLNILLSWAAMSGKKLAER